MLSGKQKIIITGYYNKKNTGDDLFLDIAMKMLGNNSNYEIKIVPIDVIEKNITLVAALAETIVLFGGEVLNNYFLKPLADIKQVNQKIKLYAIGVGLGQDISEINYMVSMFQYIICRHQYDCNIIRNKFPYIKTEYVQDLAFLHDIRGYHKTVFRPVAVGFFLSQPKYNYMNENDKTIYKNNIINLMTKFISFGYEIKLFSMCYNNIETESDIIINTELIQLINNKKVTLVDSQNFDQELLYIKYAICERFHSHILCLIYNVPFVSFADTNKVKKLLEDITLQDLLIDNHDPVFVLNKLNKISKDYLKKIYKHVYQSVETFYKPLLDNKLEDLFLDYPKHKIQLYLDNSTIANYCKDIESTYLTTDHPTEYVMMNIFGESNNECTWGTQQKIENGTYTINDIIWLFEKSIETDPFLFSKIAAVKKIDFCEKKLLNIDYITQYDKIGVHRAGWRYVVDNMSYNLCSYDSTCLKCDMYIDRTFHWEKDAMKTAKIIPYTSSWFGFIHHTLYQDNGGYNCVTLFHCAEFIESLKCCKGLIVLSQYLKDQLLVLAKDNKVTIPNIYVLFHPTCVVDVRYHWNSELWKGEIIQIGAWMRNIKAIYELKYNNKYALVGKKIEGKYISFTKDHDPCDIYYNDDYPVKMIKYLENDLYDDLLTRYIVFLNLFDASAVNTIIECIVRNTPIIVNKLPAVIEYLGEEYPLYYTDINTVPEMIADKHLIHKASLYLSHLNKDFLTIENFIWNLKNIVGELSI